MGVNLDKLETIAKECFGFGASTYNIETGEFVTVQFILEEGYTCPAEALVKFITEVSQDIVTSLDKVILSIEHITAKHVTLGVTFPLENI